MISLAPSGKKSWGRFWLILGVATLLALFFATKDSFAQRAMDLPVRWGKNLWWKGMEWYAWAGFSPLVFRVCRKFDLSGGRWRVILGQLAAAILFSLLHSGVVTTGAWIEARVIRSGLSFGKLSQIVLTNYFHEDVLTYAGIVSVWYALNYHQQFRERERRAAELEGQLAQARLQSLKMQLHPHFLFNTLNGIASLIYENPKAANRMLARLSELLRLALDDDGLQEVPLKTELDFNRRYLDLEQMRLGERLKVNLEIAPETLDASVPKLLLQPLVENAIRHGIAPYSAAGEISIRSHRHKGALHLRVADNGPALAGRRDAPNGTGVGLKNTRARLQQLYGDQQRLELKKAAGGGFIVEITIPFSTVEIPKNRFEAET